MQNKEKQMFFASLFLSGKPLNLKFFREMFDPINMENRLDEFAQQFNNMQTGLFIRKVAEGYQMVTDTAIFDELSRYFGEKAENLSKAAMETVAVVAYKQPVTKIEIEELRGVNSAGVIRQLLDKNLIRVMGRKDVPGRPMLYCTTKYFLEYFNLKTLSELPTFREWQELKQS
ncbi:MAG: SMC-Scp complex subunit ScpB [Flexistipes sinusarabici]|uniref:SMC-Scp complex subunit ScpB n=1 Tax=Flexistipes sinusarabici TaxID=2352 RepID=A0A5D0MY70_FLESI|nr:SMC-Scp complex subunit ScpB [Flexistipes sinusarabici]TYB36992.1 MAG: SMC-Scp complex subunit ScpB [Flexistipes sinusarabici]